MEDSTAMTIEFLRARLLSERSVSRTARQRADQLTKRVAELEEQLKIVSIQRKKAEKAAVHVLAILEDHGINELSEASDYSSEQDEVLSESIENGNSIKEEKNSTNSQLIRNEVDDGFSGSEHEASPSINRSLSWKSSNNLPNSLDKKFGQPRRRHSGCLSTSGPSPKQRLGKSCRQIKLRETRDESILLGAEDNGTGFGLKVREDISNGRHKDEDEKALSGLMSCGEDQRREPDASLHESGRDVDMERALEHQAQLIGQYEAEENAQRKWEEKYRENNSYTPDSCEPGNQSDVTDERNELKAESADLANTISSYHASELVDLIPYYEKEASPKVDENCRGKEGTSRSLNSSFVPADQLALRAKNGNSPNQLNQYENRILVNESETGVQEFEFPGQEHQEGNKKNLELSGNNSDNGVLHDLNFQTRPYGSPEIQSMQSFSVGVESLSKGERTWSQNCDGMRHRTTNGYQEFVSRGQEYLGTNLRGKQNQQLLESSSGIVVHNQSTIEPAHGSPEIQNSHREVPRQTPNPLGEVLGALHCAKLSLQNQLHGVPTPSQAVAITVPNPQIRAIKASDTPDIPLRYTGLFRTPAELRSGSTQTNFSLPYKDFGLSLSRHCSHMGAETAAGDQYPSSSYLGSGSGSSLCASPPYFNPYLDPAIAIHAASRHTYPYRELTARMPANEGLHGPNSDRRIVMPADSYSLYDERGRTNMHRQ